MHLTYEEGPAGSPLPTLKYPEQWLLSEILSVSHSLLSALLRCCQIRDPWEYRTAVHLKSLRYLNAAYLDVKQPLLLDIPTIPSTVQCIEFIPA